MLTVSEVAKRLGVHPDTVRRIPNEVLPVTRTPGGQRRYDGDAVEAYCAKRASDTTEGGCLNLKRDIFVDGLQFGDSRELPIPNREYAVRVATEFALRVRATIDSSALVFVFGSSVRNSAHYGSDVDVAVVSDRLRGLNDVADSRTLSDALFACDVLIEIHTYNTDQWECDEYALPREIRQTGVSV